MGMSGGSGGSRGRRGRGTLSEINVTPLVDVMLVLLIMFMVTVPMMQQGIDVDLPETSSSGVDTTEDPLVLTISDKRKLTIGEADVPIKGLSRKISAIFKTRKNKQIYIRADKNVDYGLVAEAMGEIRAAGIFKIGLVTLPKSR